MEPIGLTEEPRPWTVLASDYLFRKPWLTLRRDRVQLPAGAIIEEYYVLEYSPWVNVIALTQNDEVVMVRQYRHGLGKTSYELPAGVVDSGDKDLETAARRELLEETGFGGGRWQKWLACSANAGTHNNLAHTFLAIDVERISDPSLETTEDLKTCIVPIARVQELIETGQIMQALNLAPLLKYLLSRA